MNSSMTITLPWLTNSTNSVMRRPRPVSVMPPTMMPAVAVATPMPIMLREPSVMPPMTSRGRAARRHPAAACAVQRQRTLGQHQHDQDRDGPEGRQRRRQLLHHQAPDQGADGDQEVQPGPHRGPGVQGLGVVDVDVFGQVGAACRLPDADAVEGQHHRAHRPGGGRPQPGLDGREQVVQQPPPPPGCPTARAPGAGPPRPRSAAGAG